MHLRRVGERGFESRPVGVAFDNEVVAVGGESVDGTLSPNRVGERGEPFVGASIRREDHRAGAVSFEEDLVGVAAFLKVHGIEAEVIDDEKLGSQKLSELLLVGLEEAGLLEGLEHAVGAKGEHGITAATGEMSECVSEEGFADTDVADDGDVVMRFDEAERGELGEQSLVEVNLGGRVPVFETGFGLEASFLGAKSRGESIATLSLVGEDKEKEVLVRGFVLSSENKPLGQRIEHARELESPEHGAKIGFDGFGHCDSPLWGLGWESGRAYCWNGLR
jgi:hypothetical protein